MNATKTPWNVTVAIYAMVAVVVFVLLYVTTQNALYAIATIVSAIVCTTASVSDIVATCRRSRRLSELSDAEVSHGEEKNANGS